jgi:hypothetical protein
LRLLRRHVIRGAGSGVNYRFRWSFGVS